MPLMPDGRIKFGYTELISFCSKNQGMTPRLRALSIGDTSGTVEVHTNFGGRFIYANVYPNTAEMTDWTNNILPTTDLGLTVEGWDKHVTPKAGPQPIEYAMGNCAYEGPTDVECGRIGAASFLGTPTSGFTLTGIAQDGATALMDLCYARIVPSFNRTITQAGYPLLVSAGTTIGTLKITYNGGTPVDNVAANTAGVVVHGGAAGVLTLTTGVIPAVLPLTDTVKTGAVTSTSNPAIAYARWAIPEELSLNGIAAEWQAMPRFSMFEIDTGFYTNVNDETTWHRMGGFTLADQGITIAGDNNTPIPMPPGGTWASATIYPMLPISFDASGAPFVDMTGAGTYYQQYIRIKAQRFFALPKDTAGNEIRPYMDMDFDLTRKK